jgi:drug/metabolite transporter (DMT)-like permease
LIRPGGRPNGIGIGLAAVAGVLDLSANTAYMMSTQMGRIDIASVLASLYPAVTVLLAFFVNGEKISTLQRIGLVATIAATALIAL